MVFTSGPASFISFTWLKLSTCQETVVEQCDGCHGFYDGYGTGQYAGIVAAAGGEGGGLAVDGDGVLLHEQGGHGLEGYAEVDVLSVADAALDASAVVGAGGDASVPVGDEDVVLLAAALAGTGKS